MKRNRPQTEQRIVEAAISLIADAGFTDFGVNHIAARAGVDKVLIYRYFGGVDGLLERIGRKEALFPEAEKIAAASLPEFIEEYRIAMAGNPLSRALLDWVRLTENPLTQAFLRQRRHFWDEVRDFMRPDPAVNVVLDMLAELPVNAFSADTLGPLLERLGESPEVAQVSTREFAPSQREGGATMPEGVDLPTNLL